MKEKKYLQFFIYMLVLMLAIGFLSVEYVYADEPPIVPVPNLPIIPNLPAPTPSPPPDDENGQVMDEQGGTPPLASTPLPSFQIRNASHIENIRIYIDEQHLPIVNGVVQSNIITSGEHLVRVTGTNINNTYRTVRQNYTLDLSTISVFVHLRAINASPRIINGRILIDGYPHYINITNSGFEYTHIEGLQAGRHEVEVVGDNIPSTPMTIQTSPQGRGTLDLADIRTIVPLRIINVPPGIRRITLRYRNDEIPEVDINVEHGRDETVEVYEGRDWSVTFYDDRGQFRNIPIMPLGSPYPRDPTVAIQKLDTLDVEDILNLRLEAPPYVEEPTPEEPNNILQQNDTSSSSGIGDTWFDRMFPVFMLAAAVIIVFLLIMLLMNFGTSTPKRGRSAPSYDSRNEPAYNSIIRAMDIKTNRYNNDNAVSFSIHERELIYITGRSGAGKTVLLKMLAGYDKNTSGQLMFDIDGNKLTWQNNDKELKSLIGFVPQLDSLYGNLTPYQMLDYYCKCFYGKTSKIKIENSLSTLGLFERKDNKIDSLSGGQRKRVSIAIELLRNARILILDEPDSGLDLESREDLYNMLEDVRLHNGVTIILSTHFQENIEYSDVERIPIYDSRANNSSSKAEKIKMHRRLADQY